MGAVTVENHPLLRVSTFTTTFEGLDTPPALAALLQPDAATPFERDEDLRVAVRDMLRHGGYKPTGRGKPASEYLVKAAPLRSINLAVDACNAVSLHSGFPISVVDATPPFRIAIAGEDARYVFNPSGQEIDLKGLVCLFDAEGPCGNAVKDSQRTKTHSGTTETLSVVWGCAGYEARLERAAAWYRELLEGAGAKTYN